MRYFSNGGGTGGVSHIGSVCNMNGNRYVLELWNDNGKRNVNLNNCDDDWNPNYRFLRVRNSYFFFSLS